MSTIMSSASKIVFILITLALIAGLFLNKIDPKDFMVLSSMVYAFYFTRKDTPQFSNSQTTTTTNSATEPIEPLG